MSFITDRLAPKNKFHQDPAKLDTTNYQPGIGQATNNAQQVYGQQQGVVGQLGNIAAGKGPNPAQEMLRQQTSQNINTAAGQAASARGINPALAARMAVDSGATANQQAAGQGAALQAQQSLGALGQQGQVLQGMGQNQNQMFGLASQAQNQQNQANIANTLGAGQINAGVAAQNTQLSSNMLGGLLNGAGGMLGIPLTAGGGGGKFAGGEIAPPGYAFGGGPGYDPQPPFQSEYAPEAQPQLHSYMDSLAALHAPPAPNLSPGPLQLGAMNAPPPAAPSTMAQRAGGGLKGIGEGLQRDSLGGFDRFARMRTPGLTMADGGSVPIDFTGGGRVPGVPPVPQTDTPENDVVPAMLTPKEVVLPLSVTQHPNAPEAAKSFVEHLLRSKGKASGYDRVLQARGLAEGGQVQDPENFQRRQLPEDAPLGEGREFAPVPDVVPPSGNEPFIFLDPAPRVEVEKRRPQKLAEGGPVEGEEPGLVDSVKGWWAAPRGSPEETEAGKRVADATNALLPDFISGRGAVKKYRSRQAEMDAQTKD